MRYLALLFIFFFPSITFGAIAFDLSSDQVGNGLTDSSITVSHTTAGVNRLLLSCTREIDGAANYTVTGVTYNGVSMTELQSLIIGDSTLRQWYLIAPTSGANNIVSTFTRSLDSVNATAVYGMSYNGVKQTGFPDAQDTDSGTGTSFTSSITTVADLSWVALCGLQRVGGTITAGTGLTARETPDAVIGGDSNASVTPAGVYSQSASWSGSGDFGNLQVSFAQADIVIDSVLDWWFMLWGF